MLFWLKFLGLNCVLVVISRFELCLAVIYRLEVCLGCDF